MYEAQLFEPSTVFDSWDGAQLTETALSPQVARAQPEARNFELPRTVWLSMLACYAVFFLALAIAFKASAAALFMIAISVGYTAIYFGVAAKLAAQNGADERSPLDRGGPLQTWTGPMSRSAVYSQILIVPLVVALFGAAVSVIVFAAG